MILSQLNHLHSGLNHGIQCQRAWVLRSAPQSIAFLSLLLAMRLTVPPPINQSPPGFLLSLSLRVCIFLPTIEVYSPLDVSSSDIRLGVAVLSYLVEPRALSQSLVHWRVSSNNSTLWELLRLYHHPSTSIHRLNSCSSIVRAGGLLTTCLCTT